MATTRERRGSVYARGGVLWISYWDAAGRRVRRSTGLPVGQEKTAERALEQIRQRIAAGAEIGAVDGPPTVRDYGRRWIERREARELAMAKEDRRRLDLYIYPVLGSMRLEDVRHRHVVRLIEELRRRPSERGGTLAPRTIRAAYSTLRQLMADAVRDELIATNPCMLARGDLPAVEDKDPEWRGGAVFSREELELLISHPDIPEDRRVVYALLGMTGMRFGELAALRWRHYDPATEPLGRITVAAAYSRHRKRIGRTKTRVVRPVPVHPTLARILAAWRLSGWQAMVGRPPGPDDLVVPSRELGAEGALRVRSGVRSLRRLHEDLERLHLRPRRLHDLRRTMISITRDAGAPKDLVGLMTHTPRKADVVELYSSLLWQTFCEAIARVRIELRDGQVIPLRQAASARVTVVAQPGSEPQPDKEKPRKSHDLRGSSMVGETGFEGVHAGRHDVPPSDASSARYSVFPPGDSQGNATDHHGSGVDCDSVTRALADAMSAWVQHPDAPDLRRRLEAILAQLGGASGR